MVQNRRLIMYASFLTLIAAGMGFAIRAGLLKTWSGQYGFTMTELGTITGGGLLGFGLVILFAGLIIDKVGYKPLLIIAFLLHVISAAMTFAATPVYNSAGQDATFYVLFWAAFIFAVANGICEAVINPLIAAIYPEQKTHYLNILHAGWPGGLVIGGIIALFAGKVGWELLLATYLIPSVAYGLITLTQMFPKTEAQSGTISYAGMLKDCLVPLFLVILLVHAMVGYVELGTDSWISKITGAILADPQKGTMLFIYTSTLMFILRFFAGPIVHQISSLGLLFVSAIFGAIGLFLLGTVEGVLMMVFAATVYAVGKTFLWPTMLGVVGEQFPRSSTIAMAMLGAAGMISAGMLGGPGIGYKQDYFATQNLQESSEETYERYKAGSEKSFLFFPKITGLDGRKVGVVENSGANLTDEINMLGDKIDDEKYESLRELRDWWEENKQYAGYDTGDPSDINIDVPELDLDDEGDDGEETAETEPAKKNDQELVNDAVLFGSRQAMKYTALIPCTMAVFYLLMILGYKAKGGYRPKEDGPDEKKPEK